MADTQIVNISGTAKVSAKLTGIATRLHGPKFAACVGQLVEDAVAVKALAGLLDRAIEHALAKDGRIDLEKAAIFMMREMRNHQK